MEHRYRLDGIFVESFQPLPYSDSCEDNGAVKRYLKYVSGSFKVLIWTLKELRIQVVFHFFIQLMCVTLEEKGEDMRSEQLLI